MDSVPFVSFVKDRVSHCAAEVRRIEKRVEIAESRLDQRRGLEARKRAAFKNLCGVHAEVGERAQSRWEAVRDLHARSCAIAKSLHRRAVTRLDSLEKSLEAARHSLEVANKTLLSLQSLAPTPSEVSELEELRNSPEVNEAESEMKTLGSERLSLEVFNEDLHSMQDSRTVQVQPEVPSLVQLEKSLPVAALGTENDHPGSARRSLEGSNKAPSPLRDPRASQVPQEVPKISEFESLGTADLETEYKPLETAPHSLEAVENARLQDSRKAQLSPDGTEPGSFQPRNGSPGWG